MYGTKWQNDELAGNGSYTNFRIGLDTGDKDILCLREGMPELGVWFAGVSPPRVQSFVLAFFVCSSNLLWHREAGSSVMRITGDILIAIERVSQSQYERALVNEFIYS